MTEPQQSQQAEPGISAEEAELFARGLYFLASLDGINAREERLIREFLAESGASLPYEELEGTSFSPLEAATVLQTTFMQRVFVKAAIALVKADGHFSDAERHALGEIADAFGVTNAEFGDLEQEAEKAQLE
jgi:tellurite resistance protein